MPDSVHHDADDLRDVLANLITLALVQEPDRIRDARAAAARLHAAGRARWAAEPELNLSGPWFLASRRIEPAALADEDLRASPRLPAECPLALADLTGPTLDFDGLAERIRSSAATG